MNYKLVVVVARDENVKKLKGEMPLNNEKKRFALIKSLDFIDEAVLGDRELRKWGGCKMLSSNHNCFRL